MGTINSLLEGSSPYKALQNEAGKLTNKWRKSGLLEGIESSTEKNNMSILLENQAKQLVNESNSLGSAGTQTSITTGNSEAWAGVALPLVRRVFGEIVAKDLVSVQPMNLPAGLIFYLDFRYGTNGLQQSLGNSLYSANADMTKTTLPTAGTNSGLYGVGTFAYSATSASADVYVTGGAASDHFDHRALVSANTASAGLLTVNDSASVNYDADFLQYLTDNSVTLTAVEAVFVSTASFSNPDLNSVRTWQINGVTNYNQFNTWDQTNNWVVMYAEASDFTFATGGNDVSTPSAFKVNYNTAPDNLNDRGDFEDSFPSQGSGNVSTLNIPEINVQLKSDTVAAKTRKLKAQWTPEFAQDLNAYHSIDAEAELTSILSEYISMEIDLELLDMLILNADTTDAWSAKINKEMKTPTTPTGYSYNQSHYEQISSGTYYTKMSWFQTLGVKLQKVSNIIHQKTLRGGANFMVVSPTISTVLESIPGFASDSSGDDDKYAMGVQKIGAINSRYTVYKNPYMTENIILMGYKGSQFLETGAVFAPYIPLIMTPLVYDPTSFTPRKGIMTRYAKKMVRPDFYGKVIIRAMNEI